MNDKQFHAKMYWLQSAARDVFFGERVSVCCRLPIPKKQVEIWGNIEAKRAKYKNVARCASVWLCPVCANQITASRRNSLAAVIDKIDDYCDIVSIAFTLEHHRADDLIDTLTCLQDAWRFMVSCRKWAGMKKRDVMFGYVRSLEVTWGYSNGWHPHIHASFFLRKRESLSRFYNDIRSWWAESVAKAGGRSVWEYATRLSVHNSDSALYPVKWGIAEEIMRGAMKQGKQGGLTPFQMLEMYLSSTRPGPAFWGKLLKEYQKSIKGARQVTWSRSPNLRNVAGLDDEKPESKMLEADEAGFVFLAALTDSQWRAIVDANERGTILDCCASGNVELAMRIIKDIEQDSLARIDKNTS